ncbi:hypothetical protein PR048_014406 [Dryococelus australis]|uniref:Uncharacterized protein n=1 Tax=Dryococelus australis TaxID=614101 RepID=A0ABQ9HEC3_9NEOP|nr:hypothetical protein PR048_014406 [Dryococelus australis]
MIYAAPAWSYAENMHIRNIKIAQKKTIRRITHITRYVPTTPIHRELGLETIRDYMVKPAQTFYQTTTDHLDPLIRALSQYGIEDKWRHNRPSSLEPHIQPPMELHLQLQGSATARDSHQGLAVPHQNTIQQASSEDVSHRTLAPCQETLYDNGFACSPQVPM